MELYEQLIYKNSRGESITFGIGSVYHVNVSKDVTGISDLKDTIYSTSSMGQHGDTYVGVRIEPRDIVLTGKIKDERKEAQLRLRREALRILNPELEGTLYYIYGDFMQKIGAKVDGTPEFYRSKEAPSQLFDISFKCLDPFWKDEQETREDIASWIGAWIFPTVIDKDDPTSMIFGYREESLIVDVYNPGHVATGMRIKLKALGQLTGPSLLNVNTREFLKLNMTLYAGDVVDIDTSYGKKTVVLTRAGVKSNVFRYIDVDSTFMQLDIGDNVFRYDAESGLDSLDVTLSFNAMYLGV